MLAGFLPQIRDLRQIRQDVIPVESQQGVPIEQDRADRADEHHTQTDLIQQHTRLTKPPEKRGNGRQNRFHVHSRRSDGRPVPLIRQQPGVGNVAVQARREHQNHDADFMALTSEFLTRQSMAELVKDLGDRQRHSQPEPVLGAKELVERRQPLPKDVELTTDQQQSGQSDRSEEHQCPLGKKPVRERRQPVENPVRDQSP